MKSRSIKKVTHGHNFKMSFLKIHQPLPAEGIEQVSPFILLHHAGPQEHQPGEIRDRLHPHPHRGFEPVTFLFSGKMHHKDSTGSEGFLESGDVQWMTAGKGIIHSEGPSSQFVTEGGTLELIQLWVNLPRANKMTEPKYQDIKKKDIPVVQFENISAHVVAGTINGVHGPASTFTSMNAVMGYFTENGKAAIEIPANHNALLYLLDGYLNIGETTYSDKEMIVFANDGDNISIETLSEGKFLLLTGEPINEPVVQQGPFVMNYPAEIQEAIMDYHEGKMGTLEE